MEQITTPTTQTEKTQAKTTKAPDRIALTITEAGKVENWLSQIREASKGYLNISKSDVVNFLIREHRDTLLGSEIKRIRTDHYNPVRHIQWIMPQLKELRAIELSVVGGDVPGESTEAPTEPKPRKKRSQKTDHAGPLTESKNSEISAENQPK